MNINLSNKQKRFLNVTVIVIFIVVMVIKIFCNFDYDEKEVLTCKYNPMPVAYAVPEIKIKDEINIYEQKSQEITLALEKLEPLKETDKQGYLYKYNEIVELYRGYFDPPETLQDYFTEEEITLLYQVVEAEATGGTFDNKANVASVIFNRIKCESFGATLSAVLIKKQFSCISDGRYKTVEITQDTIEACEYAFIIEDTAQGCIYFESGDITHSKYADFIFEDSIGHYFYAERKTGNEE